MSIYRKKQHWKLLLLTTALFIGIASLWYTDKLVKQLSDEEKKKVELWAEGTRQLANIKEDVGDISFIFEVVKNNNTVPVILTDENNEIQSFRNLDSLQAATDNRYLKEQLATMQIQHEPIEISLIGGKNQHIYYKDSILLTRLRYYPYFQLGVIGLFLLVSYLAFSASRKAEQNQVWVGMAKETAHQLGTPLSSLTGWLELLKIKGIKKEYTDELEKDLHRLTTITERFSKIGAPPVLKKENIQAIVLQSVNYIRTRTSEKVSFSVNSENNEIIIPINIPLFQWVIENLLKNAIDAMNGQGEISISITDQHQFVYIDFSDTGKGVPRQAFKTIFNPGYTTKSRGWGLGLSLVKRIVEEYHQGHVFVKSSEAGQGTIFRVVLKKNNYTAFRSSQQTATP